VQRAEKASFPPGEAREDWTIFRAVSDLIGKPLPFDRFDQLRAAMGAEVPALGVEGLIDMPWAPPSLPAAASGAVTLPVKDFYLTNAISRASPVMQRCSAELIHGETFAEAAE
jgi:NADH-quinone oxidoreductase subunit G